jgi:ABC-type multidrug transport system ATPase subunit
MEEAERLCDRVAIVDHGRSSRSARPAELVAGLHAPHIVEFSTSRTVAEILLAPSRARRRGAGATAAGSSARPRSRRRCPR